MTEGPDGKDGGDRWEGRKGLGWSWGAPRVAHDCHSREGGNPEARAGIQGPAVLGWWDAACLSSGEEKRPWIPAYNLRE